MTCENGSVLTMGSRGVVHLSTYINEIIDKVVPPAGQLSHTKTSFAETLYSRSFSCSSCAQSAIEAVQEKLALLEIHNYHILPPCESLSLSTFIVRISGCLIFGFLNGPVIPVVVSEKNWEQQKTLIHDIYTLSVFNKLFP